MRRRLPALVAASALIVACGLTAGCAANGSAVIKGPFASLLDSSTDLGPSRSGDAQLTVTLPGSARPEELMAWASARAMWVRWRPGDGWAIVEGAAGDVARGFEVPVNDYRGRKGQVFYASPVQPSVPEALRDVVTGLGRIMGYTPHRTKRPDNLPLDVPKGGLTPGGLLDAYNAGPLAEEGYTGKGTTIVFFEFDAFDQKDLDTFADTSGLPRFTPEVIGGLPDEWRDKMDLSGTSDCAGSTARVRQRQTDPGETALREDWPDVRGGPQFPGAVWSLSIGWACDGQRRPRSVESALARRRHDAFDATGTPVLNARVPTNGHPRRDRMTLAWMRSHRSPR